MAIGFPKGPGKDQRSRVGGGSVEQLSSLREALLGARAQPALWKQQPWSQLDGHDGLGLDGREGKYCVLWLFLARGCLSRCCAVELLRCWSSLRIGTDQDGSR